MVKLRVWSSSRGFFIAEGITPEWLILDGLQSLEFPMMATEKGCVWEQWTTFIDKNGKDIYVGDIIRLEDDTVGEVLFENGNFFHTAPSKLMGLLYWNEVVGNIHENLELIGETIS